MLRLLAWLVARVIYRLRVVGGDHVPPVGPALLLSNHVSYVDWLIIIAATRRKVRFVIASNFVRTPFFGWVLRLCRVIPLDRRVGPKSLMNTFSAINDALAKGECVCMFPEGGPTRNGVPLPFRRGFEQLARVAPTPLIPVYLDQLWGSIFSYRYGRLFWKWPERRRYPVRLVFGPPLPNVTTAPQVRQVIVEMAAEVAKLRTSTCKPPHRQFVRMAARHPFRPCLIDTTGAEPRTLSFGKALAGAHCLAQWLKPRVGDTPMVGLWLPSSVGGVLANLALCLLGKTAVNLNYTAGPDAVASAMRQCGLKHVLTSRKFLARVGLDLSTGISFIHLDEAAGQIPNFQKVNAFLWIVLLPGWLLEWLLGLSRHKPSDLLTVIFSSGSTGEPKGIMLTNQNIASNVEMFIDFVDFTHNDRVLGILPFFHSFGYTVTLWGPLLAGAPAVYHPDPRAAKEVGELCRKFGCRLMGATATFLRFYLRRCEPDDFRTMRLLVCGAEKLPPPLITEFKAKFGVEPLEAYGCTELSPAVSANVPDTLINRVRQVGTKVGTIGHPLLGIAVRIVDPDSDLPLPNGSEGLVMVTGPNVMKGYLGREDLTRTAIRAGWYSTGDMGRIDDDGFVTLTGRLARFAKIGGEMVPLEMIEEELHKILATTERVLAVTSVTCQRKGERMVILHLPLPGMSVGQLLDRLAQRGLPNLWQPDARDFFAVPELPILGSGKLDLQRVKQFAVERANGAVR